MDRKLLKKFGIVFPYAIIVFYFIGLIASLKLGNINYAISGSILAVPAVIGSFLLINIQNDAFSIKSIDIFSIQQKNLVLAFVISFTLSIIASFIFNSFNFLYLIFVIIAAIIIILQIASKNLIPSLILLEIMLLLSNIIYVSIYQVPLYFGWTDLMPHIHLSYVTQVTGHVVPFDLAYSYSNFPLYHIWEAVGSILSGLEIKESLFLITCPVFIVGIIFLYYIALKITQNQQLSLLACLVFAFNPFVIFYGKYIITRTLAFVGFFILLYVIYNVHGKKNKFGFNSILLFMSAFIVLVHQVSVPLILVLLVLLLIFEYIVWKERYVNPFAIASLAVLFVSYWMYVALDFTNILITRLEPGASAGPQLILDLSQYSPDIFLFSNVEVLIFLFFAIIGIGYALYHQKPSYIPVIALFALVAIVLYIPNPLLKFWEFSEILRVDRIKLLISPFLALIMALGMYVMIQYFTRKRSSTYAILIILALFSIYCFGSFNEFDGLQTLESHIEYNSTIYSDYYIYRYFQKPNFTLTKQFGIPYYNSRMIQSSDTISNRRGLFIIAREQLLYDGLQFLQEEGLNPEGTLYTFIPSQENVLVLYQKLNKKDKVYSNCAIDMYYS
jgi:hypothetical protein